MTRFNPLMKCFAYLLDGYNERRNLKPNEDPDRTLAVVILRWLRDKNRFVLVSWMFGDAEEIDD